MRALLVMCNVAGWSAAQIITQMGCTCKASSEVKWELAGGGMGGGFSHYGCSTGPYEDRSPAQGQNWCDTQQSGCNDGQGWDFCVPSSAKTSKGIKSSFAAEAVNVNFGMQAPPPPPALQNSVSTSINNNQQAGLSLNVNVNVGNNGGAVAPIKTLKGCTCHPTSEVILLQNRVRVGGGFSHTGCGTGPYEADSPGKGSPWCDTVETLCSAGWDFCIPPAGQQTSTAQQQTSYTPPLPPYTPATDSFTAYHNNGAYTPVFAPTPQPWVPPPTFQAWLPPTPLPWVPPTPQPWVPPAPTPQPWVPPTPQPWSAAVNPLKPFQQTSSVVPRTPAFQPVQTPGYQSPQTQQQYQYNAQQSPSAYLVQSTSGTSSGQRSTSSQARGSPVARQSRGGRMNSRGGGPDYYDYDDSSSSTSSLLPLMLLNKGTSASSSTSTSNNLLPLMLASQGRGSSSMLPMMMMSGGFGGSSSSSNLLSQFAMFNAFRREGEGEAQNSTNLGELGQKLGFTRAVVTKETIAQATNVTDVGSQDSN